MKHTSGVCGVLIKFPLHGVHRFKLPRLLDMSNRLSCDHKHVDNFVALIMVNV
jgi:hypothetical protein